MRSRLPSWLMPYASKAIHTGARWTRPMTLGARAAIFDAPGRVFLVKHSYVRGWHLPGGAVEPGETIEEALRREVREETGIEISARPRLHGLFFNRQASRRDHVAVYVVDAFHMPAAAPGGFEIVDQGFFPAGELPAGTVSATRARLHEITTGAAPASDW